MELFVIRHAAAEERDAARWPDDSMRPLTESGRKKFRRVARRLGDLVEDAPLVLSSRWVRAWDTAGILAAETGWPQPQACPELELQPNKRVINTLRGHSQRSTIALVGHEPQLGQLVSLMLTGDEDRLTLDFKKGSVVCLTLPPAIVLGAATLNWILTPRLANP